MWLFSHHFYPPRGWGLGNSTSLPLLSLIPGAVLRFADAEQRSWFDPALWQDVSPAGGQEPAGRIFSVDEERVPCQYDDVIFQPQTSFRVNLDSSQQVIHLRSISLMGQVTRSWGEPPQHLLTASPGRCSTRQRMIRGFGDFFLPTVPPRGCLWPRHVSATAVLRAPRDARLPPAAWMCPAG